MPNQLKNVQGVAKYLERLVNFTLAEVEVADVVELSCAGRVVGWALEDGQPGGKVKVRRIEPALF